MNHSFEQEDMDTTETESSSSTDIETLIDMIYDLEVDFLDEEKRNETYYIGICNATPHGGILLGTCISPQTFHQFPYEAVLYYLTQYNMMKSLRNQIHSVEILQTCFHTRRITLNGTVHIFTTYQVIVKTFWLKMFQRKWREYYRWKMERDNRKKRLHTQRYFEIWGKYPPQHVYTVISLG